MLVNGLSQKKSKEDEKKDVYMILICIRLILLETHCEVSYIGNKLGRVQNKGQICFTSHWPHSISGFIYFEFDIRFCKIKEQRRIKCH